MKRLHLLLVGALAGGFSCGGFAQGFNSGSDGSLGDLNVTTDTTIDLPADGKLHYASVTVASGARLKFNRNALNTPVYLLSQGDVVIDGTIDVNGQQAPSNVPIGGQGGPGGFDGGKPGFGAEVPPGDGYGPGGGKGGTSACDGNTGGGGGSYGTRRADVLLSGPTYGSPLLIPLIGGSGGAGGSGQPGAAGGGGGGAILVASNTRIQINGGGGVEAIGGEHRNCVNGGSGGAVRLLAPVVEGMGTVNVRPGTGGGLGRIRVDTIDRRDLRLTFRDTAATTVGATMFVFPSPLPKLDVIEAAGTSILLGSNPVQITLPFGSTTDRTVVVRAENFNAVVPIAVVLTPDSGERVVVEAQVDNAAQNPATATIPVTLRPNVLTTIHVWTR